MHFVIFILIIGIVAALFFFYGPQDKPPIKVGLKAPDFKLPDQDNKKRSLSEFKGHKIMLYFYPKDNTPGCTQQACSIRDHFDVLQHNKIVVLGVNYDTPMTHKLFKEKQNLPFVLLSDEKKNVSKQYGAYANFLNVLYPERKTFLIDEHGKIIKIIDNVNLATHMHEVLGAFGVPQKHYDVSLTP